MYTRKALLGNGEGHQDPSQTVKNEGDPVVYCQNVTRISSTRLECLYPEAEGRTDGCDVGRKIYVQAAQRTYLEVDAPDLCFDEPGLLGLPTAFTVSEGGLQQQEFRGPQVFNEFSSDTGDCRQSPAGREGQAHRRLKLTI